MIGFCPHNAEVKKGAKELVAIFIFDQRILEDLDLSSKAFKPSETGAVHVEDFIIRLYRFEKDQPRALVGLVEKVGKKGRIGFTSMDELWEILNSSIGDEKEEDNAGYFQLRKKRR